MNGTAREREQREVNGGPRTRKEGTPERPPEPGLFPAGWAGRAERARWETQNLVSQLLKIAMLNRFEYP